MTMTTDIRRAVLLAADMGCTPSTAHDVADALISAAIANPELTLRQAWAAESGNYSASRCYDVAIALDLLRAAQHYGPRAGNELVFRLARRLTGLVLPAGLAD